MKLLERINRELVKMPGVHMISEDFMTHFTYSSHSYYLYAKRITGLNGGAPAERTRAQLSKSENFNVILPSDRFLFIGIDETNDVYACWDPVKTKSRLNRRQTVSLHSRLSAQENVRQGEISEVCLKSGERLVLMKPADLEYFMANMEHYFPTLLLPVESGSDLWSDSDAAQYLSTHGTEAISRVLQALNNEEVTETVCEGIECGYSVMSIVQLLSDFQNQYPEMRLGDWKLLVDIACAKMDYLKDNAEEAITEPEDE